MFSCHVFDFSLMHILVVIIKSHLDINFLNKINIMPLAQKLLKLTLRPGQQIQAARTRGSTKTLPVYNALGCDIR